MPCDTVTTQALSEKLKNAMPDLIKAAMIAEKMTIVRATADEIVGQNYRHTWTWTKGVGIKTQARGYEASAAEEDQKKLVVAYSAQCVSWAAKRNGFKFTQTAPNKITLTK